MQQHNRLICINSTLNNIWVMLVIIMLIVKCSSFVKQYYGKFCTVTEKLMH